MENKNTLITNLNDNYISSYVVELILYYFKHLSDDIAESLLTEELLRYKTASILNIEANKIENLDTLAIQIDNVFDKYKSRIVIEVRKAIESFDYQNMEKIVVENK